MTPAPNPLQSQPQRARGGGIPVVPEVRAGDRAGPQGDQTRPAWADPYGQGPCGDCVHPREMALESWGVPQGGFLVRRPLGAGSLRCDRQSLGKSESAPCRGQRRAWTREGGRARGLHLPATSSTWGSGLGPRLAWALPRPLTGSARPSSRRHTQRSRNCFQRGLFSGSEIRSQVPSFLNRTPAGQCPGGALVDRAGAGG